MDKHFFYSNKLWTTELELELEPAAIKPELVIYSPEVIVVN